MQNTSAPRSELCVFLLNNNTWAWKLGDSYDLYDLWLLSPHLNSDEHLQEMFDRMCPSSWKHSCRGSLHFGACKSAKFHWSMSVNPPPTKKDQNKTACCATVWQVGGMSANTCDAWHPNCAASHDCHRHSYSATSSRLSCSQVQSNSAKYQWVGKETVHSWRKCHFTGIKYKLSMKAASSYLLNIYCTWGMYMASQ